MEKYMAYVVNNSQNTAEEMREPHTEKIIIIVAPDYETACDAFEQAYANISGYPNYDALCDTHEFDNYVLMVDIADDIDPDRTAEYAFGEIL